jgi:hypothetical protein
VSVELNGGLFLEEAGEFAELLEFGSSEGLLDDVGDEGVGDAVVGHLELVDLLGVEVGLRLRVEAHNKFLVELTKLKFQVFCQVLKAEHVEAGAHMDAECLGESLLVPAEDLVDDVVVLDLLVLFLVPDSEIVDKDVHVGTDPHLELVGHQLDLLVLVQDPGLGLSIEGWAGPLVVVVPSPLVLVLTLMGPIGVEISVFVLISAVLGSGLVVLVVV